jgi:uncharacterized protein YjbI with pentapeptide repeats
MTPDETLELYTKGRDPWNSWAGDLLDKRKILEVNGTWQLGPKGILTGANAETQAWIEAAGADFSSLEIKENNAQKIDFSYFTFPGKANFRCVVFSKQTSFYGANFVGAANFVGSVFQEALDCERVNFAEKADFRDVIFHRDAAFWASVFEGAALFSEAEFLGTTRFGKVRFLELSLFGEATFAGECWFKQAEFVGEARFSRSVFQEVSFSECRFASSARFREAKFCGNANFTASSFDGLHSSFKEATFIKQANFSAMNVKHLFDMVGVKFGEVPNFYQAHFTEAPYLDDVSVPLPPFLGRDDPVNVANFRSLRRLAVQAHDHENELKFLKGEIRARRFTQDKWWHGAFLFGLIYDALADFGRSIYRPLLLWMIPFPLFAVLYLLTSASIIWGDHMMTLCAGGYDSAIDKALYLSVRNTFLFTLGEYQTATREVYKCLYAQERPPMYVHFIQYLQSIWSVGMFFLVALAVRNRFKIK